jgi:uncharacterized protein (DUF2141 family)
MPPHSKLEDLRSAWRDNNGNVLLATSLGVLGVACLVGYLQLIPEITATGGVSSINRLGWQSTAYLHVEVVGFPSDEGDCMISLFSWDERNLPSTPIRSATIRIDNGRSRWNLSGVPYGRYVVFAFHDRNRDGDISTEMEPGKGEYRGFSIAADTDPALLDKGPMEAIFREATFDFREDGQLVTVELHPPLSTPQ